MKIENGKIFDQLIRVLSFKICFKNERNNDERGELEFAKSVERKGWKRRK